MKKMASVLRAKVVLCSAIDEALPFCLAIFGCFYLSLQNEESAPQSNLSILVRFFSKIPSEICFSLGFASRTSLKFGLAISILN